MKRSLYSVLLGLLAGTFAAGQDASVRTPALGFVYDANLGAIRPMRGIPGAALLGDPIDPGFAVASAFFSPRQDFAIALPAADPAPRLFQFDNNGIRVRIIDGVMPSPDRTVFSPSGSAALLYQNSGRLQLLTGLPDKPVVRDLDASTLNSTPAAMAVSDDGAFSLLSGGTADAGPVRLMSIDGTSSQLALPASTRAAAFRRNGHDLIAATASGELYLVRHPEVDPDYLILSAADPQASDPVAVQFSWDGNRVLTAGAAGTLSIVELDSGLHAAISCQCRAAMLEPLALRNVFRLTPVADSHVMLLDVSNQEARVWFVPAIKTSREERSGQ